jgi:UDP-N-acetylmuramate dehydrogenase
LTQLKIENDVRLAPFTTLKIGGNARYFARADNEEQVAEAVRFSADKGIELFVLGGGSNVLIADRGFEGLTLQIRIMGISICDTVNSDKVVLTVNAGEDWDQFVEYCVSRDFAGIECLSGIPGLVGGTPIQNVGAYGQEVAETILSVRCFDRETFSFVTLDHGDCGFSYRSSIFNSSMSDRYIVLSVTFVLTPNGEPKVVYKDLIDHFGNRQPTLREVRDVVLAIRRSKSMVIDERDPDSRSAGSFFKNPIVSRAKFNEMVGPNGGMPSFDAGVDAVKIPAAWLIENAGFRKGTILGRAGISSKHTLALINRGDAAAEEMIALKNKIQSAVQDKFGISLKPEPVFVGF